MALRGWWRSAASSGQDGWSAVVSIHPARVLILTRLWAKTPRPHQVRGPVIPVGSVRFQP